MPVMVRGNKASGVFIIVNPGWPGVGLIYSVNEAFQELEKNYALVYWNYRGAGASKGNPGLENYSMTQFTDDTDLLVDTLNKLYGNPDLFMMGHSFGGEISGNYLLRPDRHAKIRSYIGVDPAMDVRLLYRKMLDAVIAYAETRRSEPYWDEAYLWCRGVEDLTNFNRDILQEYSVKSGIIKYVGDHTSWYPQIFAKSFSEAYGNTSLLMTQFWAYDSFYDPRAHVEGLEAISLPVLIICGKFENGGYSRDVMDEIALRLSTPEADKKVIQFENSGHLPFLSEPALFYETVHNHIQKVMR